MRRTVLSLLALTGTAVLMGTGPASADGATAPSPVPSAARPTAHPATGDTPRPAAPAERSRPARPVPSAEPTRAPARDQVSVVPSGAPDTGVTTASGRHQGSGTDGTAIGAGAAAVLLVGGGAVFAVRRRATGA
ncbi:sortase-dependent protein [Streptomyces sp. NPDC086081]|uniref:sortase-dependent protein n=1 Tax=unclassified Streptomyces TaxID=2593676 RepID=UPI003426D4B2